MIIVPISHNYSHNIHSLYLILYMIIQILWKEERLRHGVLEKQSYIDLGCGNGLLVYILSGEGVRRISCVILLC